MHGLGLQSCVTFHYKRRRRRRACAAATPRARVLSQAAAPGPRRVTQCRAQASMKQG
jgi:hypothetical protein